MATGQPVLAQSAFRNDINALRAFAVLAVVLYHFNVPGIHGGFSGVDIFFAISGYLMTKMIVEKNRDNNFSVLKFWRDRAVRIIPALSVMILTLLIFGFFLIEPKTYSDIGKSAISSLLFLSNIQYYGEFGYFDNLAETKWLLHTWSLSVEWQFYILYPLILIAAIRVFGKYRLGITISIIIAISFLACIAISQLKPSFSFFMLPSRAWEMLVGGLVFLKEDDFKKTSRMTNLLFFTGLALLLSSVLLLNKYMIWPSFATLAPILGTAMIVLSRAQYRFLEFRPIQMLGKWSYSIYLWHWPIVCSIRYFNLIDNSSALAVGIPLSIVFGFLSYEIIERPAQKWLKTRSETSEKLNPYAISAIVYGVLLVGGFAIAMQHGFYARSSGRSAFLADDIEARSDLKFPKNCDGVARNGRLRTCTIGQAASGGTLVVGDSHAQQWWSRYDSLHSNRQHERIVFATRGGCPPLPQVNRAAGGYNCDEFYQKSLDLAINGKFRRVVFIANWPSYFMTGQNEDTRLCIVQGNKCEPAKSKQQFQQVVFPAFSKDLEKIRRGGSEITIVLPTPVAGFDLPYLLSRREFAGRRTQDLASYPRTDHENRSEFAQQQLRNLSFLGKVSLINPAAYICNAQDCPLLDEKGHSLYRDSNHLRQSTTRQMDFLDQAILH